MKKAPAAAVEDAEDKPKQKYPGTVIVMKPHYSACKDSQGLPLETEPGNIAKCAQPISSLLFGCGLDYKFQRDAEKQSSSHVKSSQQEERAVQQPSQTSSYHHKYHLFIYLHLLMTVAFPRS